MEMEVWIGLGGLWNGLARGVCGEGRLDGRVDEAQVQATGKDEIGGHGTLV